MLETILLMLTLMPGGDVRVTFSHSADADECEAYREVVSGILEEAGNPPLVALCGETDLRVTPFVHGTRPEDEVHRYRVELPSAGGYQVTPLPAGTACTPAPQANPAVYCARSAQMVLPNG
ncbi:hypothetical protein JWJ88_12075 (plasmid) [Paracoccus methylovorus]|uniref:Uncharacterized protein n=1 Tax=Paracoccus methylovorus TaxID=2812658 RepID=A0ABX7JJ01_9RHOB|nr:MULTISPECIES: hypothetical protein [Paracoccus]QRZ14231.1 hypothetical protein JWJ88_12075 [Paracoccus methylovorus]